MTTYQYSTPDNKIIKVTLDSGIEYFVPVEPSNSHYAEILAKNITPSAYAAPPGRMVVDGVLHTDPTKRK